MTISHIQIPVFAKPSPSSIALCSVPRHPCPSLMVWTGHWDAIPCHTYKCEKRKPEPGSVTLTFAKHLSPTLDFRHAATLPTKIVSLLKTGLEIVSFPPPDSSTPFGEKVDWQLILSKCAVSCLFADFVIKYDKLQLRLKQSSTISHCIHYRSRAVRTSRRDNALCVQPIYPAVQLSLSNACVPYMPDRH